jgi:hypothetical protein
MGAAYGSAGERCMAISVAVPVGEETANRLIEKLVPKIEALKIGPASDRSSDMGPLVTAQHLAKVKGYVDRGEKEGSRVVVDGRSFRAPQGYEGGYFIGGSLFDGVTTDMTIWKEEIFGPVLSVARAANYAEAVDMVARHEYGNGVAVFTSDGDAARAFAHEVEVGDLGGPQYLGEVGRGEPAALVRTEDFGLAVSRERLLQGLDAEVRRQRDREPPGQDLLRLNKSTMTTRWTASLVAPLVRATMASAAVGQVIEECGGHLGVAEDRGPFAEAEVGGDGDAGALAELARGRRKSKAPPVALNGR